MIISVIIIIIIVLSLQPLLVTLEYVIGNWGTWPEGLLHTSDTGTQLLRLAYVTQIVDVLSGM